MLELYGALVAMFLIGLNQAYMLKTAVRKAMQSGKPVKEPLSLTMNLIAVDKPMQPVKLRKEP